MMPDFCGGAHKYWKRSISAVILALVTTGCEAGMSEHPYLQEILGNMDSYVPPAPEGGYGDINKEICAIADPEKLNEVVGEKLVNMRSHGKRLLRPRV